MADLDFAYDLTLDEARRRADRYSDLDEEQQRIYNELVSAGVLPERAGDRVTD
jgi:hypothetical protein